MATICSPFYPPAPMVVGMKCAQGLANRDEEVWIKGKFFTKRGSRAMVVTFGGILADIKEASENLLVVSVPKREVLTEDTEVPVEVSLRSGGEVLRSGTILKYRYIVPSKIESPHSGTGPQRLPWLAFHTV